MTTTKQPQAGEFWTCKGMRVRVIGLHSSGHCVCELSDGSLSILPLGAGWQHLPDCDSWTWQPEVWPKWYLAKSTQAVFSRHADGTLTIEGQRKPYVDLHWSIADDHRVSNGEWVEITEAEALARVTPQELPDDWVEITDPEHVLRKDIDEYQSQWTRGEFKKATGGVYYKKDFSAVRCRRKDLPPLPSPSTQTPVDHPTNQQLFEMVANLRDQMDAMIKRANSSPKRVPMRLWIADDGDTSWGFEVAACAEKPERTHQPHEWRELFFDGNGFFVEGQQ